MSKTRLLDAVKTLDLVETKRILDAKPELEKIWNDRYTLASKRSSIQRS